jgi:hypothetical protein
MSPGVPGLGDLRIVLKLCRRKLARHGRRRRRPKGLTRIAKTARTTRTVRTTGRKTAIRTCSRKTSTRTGSRTRRSNIKGRRKTAARRGGSESAALGSWQLAITRGLTLSPVPICHLRAVSNQNTARGASWAVPTLLRNNTTEETKKTSEKRCQGAQKTAESRGRVGVFYLLAVMLLGKTTRPKLSVQNLTLAPCRQPRRSVTQVSGSM